MNQYFFAGLFLAGFAAGWGINGIIKDNTHDQYVLEQQKAVILQQEENARKVAADAARFKEAQAQYERDKTVLGNILARTDSVRIHIPTCPSSSTVPTASKTGPNPGGTDRVADAGIDGLVAILQRRIAEIGARCAQLNLDARHLNAQIE